MVKTNKITLISSSHYALGELNSCELYKILIEINPEVIFEEIFFPRTKENICKYNIEKTVETIAINKYTNEHNVIHIPVDYDYSCIIDDMNLLYENLEKTISMKYREFNKKKSYQIGKGFKSLNSDELICILDELKIIEKETIIDLRDEKITNIFNLWEKINNKREDEMIKNILKYSKENNYNNAVFIFGVAHKESILQKLRNYKDEYKLKIDWKLYGFENKNIIDF